VPVGDDRCPPRRQERVGALTDGFRESTESWAGLLRGAKNRGMRAPALAMGDGALGFWAALRDVFPQTREQRCWFHKSANVLAALPKSAHPGAILAMQQIYNAEDLDHAKVAAKAFAIDYGAKFPKAVAKITDDLDVLLEFYRYPAEHWVHLHDQSDRVDGRDRAAPDQGHQRTGLAGSRIGDGVQAHRGCSATVACGERTAARGVGSARCDVPPGPTRSSTPGPGDEPARRRPPGPPTRDRTPRPQIPPRRGSYH